MRSETAKNAKDAKKEEESALPALSWRPWRSWRFILLLLSACGPVRQSALERPPIESIDQFALRFGERAIAGLGAVVVEGDQTELSMLSPAGTEIFHVRVDAGETTISAPTDDMQRILERIPFARDLALLYRWRCPYRCVAGDGKLVTTGTVVHWRGPGGPATVTFSDGSAILADPRRHYRLEVHGEGLR